MGRYPKFVRRHPMQPLCYDDRSDNVVIRFRRNKVVEFILDKGYFDMNRLCYECRDEPVEHEHFAQLIGYSVSGFGDLSYVSHHRYHTADKERNRLGELMDNRPPMKPLPHQPMVIDSNGMIRFVSNKLVAHIYENGPFDFASLKRSLKDVPTDEWIQFVELLGCTLEDLEVLNPLDPKTRTKLRRRADRLRRKHAV